MRPKLMIWDWNGTILDDRKLCLDIENEMLRERGMREITQEWYLNHFSFPIRAYYEMMGYTFEHESFERVSEIFMERYNARFDACALCSGVLDAVRKASESGIRQTLLSVTAQGDLLMQTARLGAAPYFSEILGQTDILGRSKVERAKAYIAQCGIAPEETLFIGDTDHDFEAAQAVGCACALLTGGHQTKEILLRCGVPVFDTAEQLLESIGL